MRQLTTAKLAHRFMAMLSHGTKEPVRIYFTGGVTALLHGWRDTTVDVDIKIDPDIDEVMRKLPGLKEELGINIELASPDQFIPELPGWQERSIYIATEGNISYYHYDPYSQALSKIERSHQRDQEDVANMINDGLIERTRLKELFAQIEDDLYRYPAIDPPSFRRKVEQITTTPKPDP
ncbi:MAG: DUF6036 family nucleotidyltransferase [Actinomycetota bacterium]